MYEEKVNSKEDQSARPTYYIHPSTLCIFKVSGPSFLCSYLEALVSLFLFRKSFCIVLNHVLDHFVAQFSFAGDQLAPDTFQEQLLESSAYMHQPLYKIVLAAKIQIRPQQIRRKNSGTCGNPFAVLWMEAGASGMRLYDNSNKLFCLRVRTPAAREENDINWDHAVAINWVVLRRFKGAPTNTTS
jgi:hypothetical protein